MHITKISIKFPFHLFLKLRWQDETLCVFICLMTKFKGLQSQEISTITKTIFCYNSSLKGEYILHYASEK